MPFPANLESLQAAGYVYSHWQVCPECGEGTEVWSTPGKRELAMQPMCELLRPAIRHYEVCKTKEEQSGTSGNVQTEVRGVRDGGEASSGGVPRDAVLQQVLHADGAGASEHQERTSQGSGIKLYGVNDPNHQLIAVGWDDGVLVCQFKTAKWSYVGVPEAEVIKLKNSPFAYHIFARNIKHKYRGTKLE